MGARSFIGFISGVLLLSLACQALRIPGIAGDSDPANHVLLNEILFLPAPGGGAFVELKSSGGRVSLDGLYLLNERDESYPLPDEVTNLASDQFLLILFDGANLVEGQTIHADRSEFLDPDSGFIELYAADATLLDRIAWGAGQSGDVRLSRGGVPSDFGPGVSIGRFPISTQPVNPQEWVIFPADEITPGSVNPNPGVTILLPLDGALLEGPDVTLSWYPIAGAVSYHLQVAGEESLVSPTVDETVATPVFTTSGLPAGEYFWRVRAIAADGATADYSSIQSFKIGTLTSSLHLARPVVQKSLNVPWFSQRKDTQMLLLESRNESGPHAWDVAHPELDPTDPADNSNCTLASVSMVNAYYQDSQEVKLSQDRIGFELLGGGGPEEDLNYDKGVWPDEVLSFALGAPARTVSFDEAPEDIWNMLKSEIDLGRPMIVVQNSHTVVITGYHEDTRTRWVMVNDPWSGQYAVDFDQVAVVAYYFLPDRSQAAPVSDEPEIHQHSDKDGIVDFDEMKRFKTDPHDDDSDKDDLKDKDDLRASIYDETFGYALSGSMIGRDFDADDIPMELDEDSDAGGCFDGMEDFNLDGRYAEPETYNFAPADDACFWGTDELLLDTTYVAEDGSHHQTLRTLAKFSLRAVENGKLEGLAQITYTHTGEFNYPDCSGTHDIGTQFFQADLKGEFYKTPDGGTFVGFQATPDHGEPYFIEWIVACSGAQPPNEQYDGWTWGGSSGTLVDGVYDYFMDFSSTAGANEFWQKIHMEQGSDQ